MRVLTRASLITGTLTEVNRQVVPLERLFQVTLPHEDVTLVPGSVRFYFSRPPSLHESLHEHIRLTHTGDFRPAHAAVLRRVNAVPAVRVTATGGHRLAEGTLAQRTREGRVDPPSGGRADHVLQKRGRQMLQSLGRHRRRCQTPGVYPEGFPDATALGQGITVTEQLLVAGALLLQASLVKFDCQMIVARGERLLGELRHCALRFNENDRMKKETKKRSFALQPSWVTRVRVLGRAYARFHADFGRVTRILRRSRPCFLSLSKITPSQHGDRGRFLVHDFQQLGVFSSWGIATEEHRNGNARGVWQLAVHAFAAALLRTLWRVRDPFHTAR